MKKSSLLSLLTAAAIVATSAGTYAAWDQVTATGSGDLKIDKKIEVNASNLSFTGGGNALGTTPSYETDVTFNVAGNDKARANTITLTPVIKSGNTDVTADFDIVITEKNGTGLTGFVDSTIAEANEYTVTITPKDATPHADETLKVSVEGTLSKN